MRKLLIIFILLLLCVGAVFPTVNNDGTNDLLKELLSGNIKTNSMLKEVIARRTGQYGTGGYYGAAGNTGTKIC